VSNIHITPWHKVTDELVISWSVMNLLDNVSYELAGNATRVFSKTYALSQGSYGFTGQQQRDTIESIVPHGNCIRNTAQQLMLWLDRQRSEKTEVVQKIQDADKVLSWSPFELVKQIHTELQENVPIAAEKASELATGNYGFFDANQEKIIKLLHRDIVRTCEVARCLALWLTSHDTT
jgi:hypothetical protein